MSEYALTPRLGLYKPTIDADDDLWGDHLNANADKLDSRVSERLSATDFGIICDGVTDQGAQLNAALAAIPIGATLYIPGSIYTTQTILVQQGRRLEMPPGTLVRPVPNDGATWLPTCAIIGPSYLSPVVLVWSASNPNGGLTNVQVTRNGTPAAGTVGLQCIGGNQYYSRVFSWNHGIGIRCGAPQATPISGQYVFITGSFDHCMIWQCYEHYLYLVNAPETTCYDMRFGVNGSGTLEDSTAIVTIDGDNNATAGGTNTVTFLRCQFNANGRYFYSVQFIKVAYQGPFKFIGCYSGGAKTAFCYIDPSCTLAQSILFQGCTFQPLSSGETFWLDPGSKSNGLKVIGCEFGPVTPASFKLTGIGAVVIGNNWYGGSIVEIDAMSGGCFIGNSANTIRITGLFTGRFAVSGNSYSTLNYSATGPVTITAHNITNVGSPFQVLSPVDNNPIRVIEPSGSTNDFIHLMPGDTSKPHTVWDTPYLIATTGGITALPGGQAAAVQIIPQIAWVAVNGNTGNGVKLPPAVAGYWQVVTNASALLVQIYGTSPHTINGIASATGIPLPPGKTAQLYCYKAGEWWGGLLT
jgi:hypothetical protein